MRYASCFLVLAVLAALAAPALAQRADAGATFARLSGGVAFVENRGQWPDEVLFLARTGGADAWVTADGVVFDFYAVERAGADPGALPHERAEASRRGHVVAMRFEGGRARRAVGRGVREGYHNYFFGDDPSRWASRVPLYEEVVLEGLYDGVDLRLYAEGGLLRYDLVVAPGADAGQIRMRMEGAESVGLTEEGALAVGTALGAVEHRGLVAYQEGALGREAVASAFVVGADESVGFAVEGADPSRALVLDPLIWATFLGSRDPDYATSVDTGADGSALVVGYTRGVGFPTTPGAYDPTFNTGGFGGPDGFVTRLSHDGSALVYSTFLGGTRIDEPYGVGFGVDGSAFVAGHTWSKDFPTTPGAFDTSHNDFGYGDGFVARLSPDGSALLYGTFLGGGRHDYAYEIDVGADGSAYVVGDTDSGNFPTTPGAFDTSHNPGVSDFDGFAARLSPDGGALIYSTYLGGTRGEGVRGVSVVADGSALVAGLTSSYGFYGFPVTPGAFDTSQNGDYDGFVLRLSADGSTLVWSTYLGGVDYDRVWGVAVGPDESAYVVGGADSPNFPVTPGAFDTSLNAAFRSDAFVARLSPDGSALVYSTFLGGSKDDIAYVVRVGTDGSAVAVGGTGSPDFPVTPGAFDMSRDGSADAFVVRLSPTGNALLYATFLGGSRYDEGHSIDLSADGSAVVVGNTFSRDFPVTPGAFDASYNGGSGSFGGDAFAARLDVGLGGPGCPLAFTAASVAPLTVAPGGQFTVMASAENHGSVSALARLDLRYAHVGGGPSGVVTLGTGWVPATLVATASVTRTVPAGAPAGSYALDLELVDVASGAVCDARPFTLTVQPARSTGAPADGPLFEGAAEGDVFSAEAASAGVPQAAEVAVWPNPAVGRAALAFGLDAPAEVRVVLYDVLGREVAAVDAGPLAAGAHRLGLDVSALPSGVYVWRLAAGARVESGRLTVAR